MKKRANSAINKNKKSASNVINKNYPLIVNANRDFIDPNKTNLPKIEKENLYKNNIELKSNINIIKQENNFLKINNKKLSNLLENKNKEINNLTKEIFNLQILLDKNLNENNNNNNKKILIEKKSKNSKKIDKIKQEYSNLLLNLEEKENEIKNLKQNIILSKQNELKIQNEIYYNELKKIKEIYYSIKNNKKNFTDKDTTILKNEIETQHNIIIVLNTNINNLKKENKNLNKIINDLNDKIKQQKKEENFLKNENKKLEKKFNNNIKNQVLEIDYKTEKKNFDKKINEMEKKLDFYRNQTIKFKNNNKNLNKNDFNEENNLNQTKKKFQISLNQIENPEKNENEKILLFQSLITELKNLNNEYLKKINFYEIQLYGEIKTKNEQNKKNVNLNIKNNNLIKLDFKEILIINFLSKNVDKNSSKNLFNFVFEQFKENDIENDENVKENLLENLSNIICLNLNCNQEKKEIFNFLNEIFESDENSNFEKNFYNFFEFENFVKNDDYKKIKINEKIKEILKKSFVKEININLLSELLFKNNIFFNKNDFMNLCINLKGNENNFFNVDINELDNIYQNNNNNNNENLNDILKEKNIKKKEEFYLEDEEVESNNYKNLISDDIQINNNEKKLETLNEKLESKDKKLNSLMDKLISSNEEENKKSENNQNFDNNSNLNNENKLYSSLINYCQKSGKTLVEIFNNNSTINVNEFEKKLENENILVTLEDKEKLINKFGDNIRLDDLDVELMEYQLN